MIVSNRHGTIALVAAAAVVCFAVEARAQSCWDTFVCFGQAMTPEEHSRCDRRALPDVMDEVRALEQCAEAACPSRSRRCLREQCASALAACTDSVPEGSITAPRSLALGHIRGTFGGGYDFTSEVPLAQFGFGYEHLWLLGGGSRPWGLGLAGDFEVDTAFTTNDEGYDEIAPVIWGTLALKYYTPMNIGTGRPAWTFGVGGRVGGGVVALELPFVAVLPSISVRMVYRFNLEIELWGGPAFGFAESTEILWLVGAAVKLGFLFRFGD